MFSRFREIEGRISADTRLCASLNRPIKWNMLVSRDYDIFSFLLVSGKWEVSFREKKT